MFRLLLLVLILLWSVTQTFIGLDVPSSKRIHYSMMSNFGLEAVRMNQKRVHLGSSASLQTGYRSGSYTSSGYAYGPLNGSQENGSQANSLQANDSRKNVPVISAASLFENSGSNRLQQVGTLDASSSQTTSIATNDVNTTRQLTKTRHLANIEKLSEQARASQQALNKPVTSNTITLDSIAFGVEARSLFGQLEAAKENVSEEIAESEASAQTHLKLALRVPNTSQELATSESVKSTESVESTASSTDVTQKPSLVFEAQVNQSAQGGVKAKLSPSESQNSQANTVRTQPFEVALTAHQNLTSLGAAKAINTVRPINAAHPTNSNQKIANSLTETSTTVVSGLEITLNPNEAIRRETPAEQQAFLWPLPTRGRLTSGYGNRVLAITNNDFHEGIDIAVKSGTPILAVKDGVIEKAGWVGNYGYAVYVRHNDGSETRYAHMSRVIVEKGEWVNQGQWLGLVGSTGLSTGPHLHFELHSGGKVVDPSKHLVFTGERLATR